jgi:predicted glycosyltransferase
MRVGLFLGHPAHFHMLKNSAKELNKNGYDVYFVIKKKDILQVLLDNAGFQYTLIRRERNSRFIDLIASVLRMEYNMCKFLRQNNIDILIGSTLSFASRVIMRTNTIVMGEDDSDVVPKYANMVYPFANAILTPIVCDNGRWNQKSTKYPSYHELAYLHPNHFTADKTIVEGYGIDTEKPYFILRFSSLNAHHDNGIQGINTAIAQQLVDTLSPHGQIYITSERELEPQFEPYRIRIKPLDMHHVMAFASLYIGDSQTMAAEAGVLGTPFVRFNDFVGRIGYLRELEDVYQLGYGIHATPLKEDSSIRLTNGQVQPSGTEALYKAVEDLVAMPADERKRIFSERRERMLSEKIDYAKYLTWFIENYPASQQETRENQENTAFWAQFK